MKKYLPELGQFTFGQPPQNYECPEYIGVLLEGIHQELCRIMINKTQEEYDSPFSNTGAKFKNKVFKVEAYSWNDEVDQPYNFKWKSVKISWYKYLGRGMSINKKITHAKAIRMFDECIKSLRDMEKKYEQQR